jgi:hypothetical protein
MAHSYKNIVYEIIIDKSEGSITEEDEYKYTMALYTYLE